MVGLDIGSSRVRAVIGERNENGILEITGVGESPSTGLRKGVVVNIEATLRSVAAAVEAAEVMSGQDVRSCWTGIGGSHIEGTNSRGVVAITGKNRETREIGPDDMARVLEAARAVPIPLDRRVLEVIPQSYIVDDQKGIRNPLDIIGVRLEAEVHIITCSLTSAQNLIKCVNRSALRVNDLILQPLAASSAVLTEDEKEQGVALIDLGGGTTELMVYHQGAPCYTTTIALGGSQVTNDIMFIEKISMETAEQIKISAGCCWEGLDEGENDIIVPGAGTRAPVTIPRSRIRETVQPRMEEILRMAQEKALQARQPVRGVVLTGGGALMPGAAELASHIFSLPVRIGTPLPMGGLGD
ncbi:MAG: cell division protein FtsA, partial [Spirochaetaceae bacterium]|nr:cell division protein FtsA [Spirochaetaceae bacterium]